MNSDFAGPINIGFDEMMSINQLVKYVMEITDKDLTIRHIPRPIGVQGKNSDSSQR